MSIDRGDAPESVATEPAHVGRAVARGARSITVALAVGQLAKVFGGLLLAVLLGVELAGVVAWVLVAQLFLDEIMRDVGFGLVIIQSKEDLREKFSSFFWLNVTIASIVCAALLMFGPALADAVGEPRVGDMYRVLGVVFLVSSPWAVLWSMLRRDLRFTELARMQITMALTGAFLPLVLYAFGLGEWSVVWSLLGSSSIVTIMAFAYTGWRPSMRFRRADLTPHLRFTVDSSATKVVNFAAANGDRVIVGGVVGTVAFGLYDFAFRLVMLPVRLLAGVASELLFPGLSRLQDDGPRLALMFRRALVIAALVIAPIAVALHVAAEPLTDAVGGDWPNSRPLVAILAFVAVPQTLMSVVFPVILAVGRTTLLFWWSLTTSCCSIVAYLIGAQFGVEGVAWSFLIVLCVLFVPHMMIAGRCARVSVFEILADLFPVVLAGAAVVPVGYAVRELLQSASSPDAVTTVAAALVVGLTFVVISVVLRIAAFRDLVSLAPGTDRAVEWLSARCTRGPSLTEPESAQA